MKPEGGVFLLGLAREHIRTGSVPLCVCVCHSCQGGTPPIRQGSPSPPLQCFSAHAHVWMYGMYKRVCARMHT